MARGLPPGRGGPGASAAVCLARDAVCGSGRGGPASSVSCDAAWGFPSLSFPLCVSVCTTRCSCVCVTVSVQTLAGWRGRAAAGRGLGARPSFGHVFMRRCCPQLTLLWVSLTASRPPGLWFPYRVSAPRTGVPSVCLSPAHGTYPQTPGDK